MFLLRIFAVKNSTKRQAAFSPARAIDGRQLVEAAACELARGNWNKLSSHKSFFI